MSNATATEDVDLTLVWTAGIILMILGAIYAMQLATQGVQCCVKRLWRASGSQFDCSLLERASTSIVQEEMDVAEASDVSAPDLRRQVFGDTTSDASDGRPTTRQSASRSGPAINASRQNTSQSGCAQRASSGGHGSATSKQSATPSGSGGNAVVTSTLNMSSQSGLVASLSLTSATQSGSAAVAGRVDQVSGDDGSKETHSEEGRAVVGSACNSWNEFQKENRGKHWGTEKMRAEYYKLKCHKK